MFHDAASFWFMVSSTWAIANMVANPFRVQWNARSKLRLHLNIRTIIRAGIAVEFRKPQLLVKLDRGSENRIAFQDHFPCPTAPSFLKGGDCQFVSDSVSAERRGDAHFRQLEVKSVVVAFDQRARSDECFSQQREQNMPTLGNDLFCGMVENSVIGLFHNKMFLDPVLIESLNRILVIGA